MQGRLLQRSRAARARHGARQRGEGKVSERLRSSEGAHPGRRVSGTSTNYESPTGQGACPALADHASAPERVRDHTPFAYAAPRRARETPEPDTKLTVVPGRSCLHDIGMYVAANEIALSCKKPIFGG